MNRSSSPQRLGNIRRRRRRRTCPEHGAGLIAQRGCRFVLRRAARDDDGDMGRRPGRNHAGGCLSGDEIAKHLLTRARRGRGAGETGNMREGRARLRASGQRYESERESCAGSQHGRKCGEASIGGFFSARVSCIGEVHTQSASSLRPPIPALAMILRFRPTAGSAGAPERRSVAIHHDTSCALETQRGQMQWRLYWYIPCSERRTLAASAGRGARAQPRRSVAEESRDTRSEAPHALSYALTRSGEIISRPFGAKAQAQKYCVR
jgi:hypothetical protein